MQASPRSAGPGCAVGLYCTQLSASPCFLPALSWWISKYSLREDGPGGGASGFYWLPLQGAGKLHPPPLKNSLWPPEGVRIHSQYPACLGPQTRKVKGATCS